MGLWWEFAGVTNLQQVQQNNEEHTYAATISENIFVGELKLVLYEGGGKTTGLSFNPDLWPLQEGREPRFSSLKDSVHRLAAFAKEPGDLISVKRCFFPFSFRLWRFLCLGWLTDHFSPSLALFFSFISFGIPSSPIFVFFKLSPFVFPHFHSFSHISRVFLTLFSLLQHSLYTSFPFFFLSVPPFYPRPSVYTVSIYGQCAQS